MQQFCSPTTHIHNYYYHHHFFRIRDAASDFPPWLDPANNSSHHQQNNRNERTISGTWRLAAPRSSPAAPCPGADGVHATLQLLEVGLFSEAFCLILRPEVLQNLSRNDTTTNNNNNNNNNNNIIIIIIINIVINITTMRMGLA
jgi:hypothetical protein